MESVTPALPILWGSYDNDTRSFIHSFFQQIYTEHLLYARMPEIQQRTKYTKIPAFMELTVLWRQTDSELKK